MFSSSSTALLPSWAWPSVSLSAIGFPLASTRAWILVVSPPRERPMHRLPERSPAAALSCAAPLYGALCVKHRLRLQLLDDIGIGLALSICGEDPHHLISGRLAEERAPIYPLFG